VSYISGIDGMASARTGITDLQLRNGTAPRWLFNRMAKLATSISDVMIDGLGTEGFLRLLADPYWFQLLSAALGFDPTSSGTTTVTCGALRKALEGRKDVALVGGKGKVSLRTPEQIADAADLKDLSEELEARLVYVSRMCAKVDSAAVQDGYRLYHHALLFDTEGNWTVIQQGMADGGGLARRYQWSSRTAGRFVEDPHTAILGFRTDDALDMTAGESEGSRRLAVDLVNDGVEHVRKEVVVLAKGQTTIDEWAGGTVRKLHMPRTVNWAGLKRAYEHQPRDYEELLAVRGVGPSAVRALALSGELLYDCSPSWKDPVRFSFAVGGEDGVPLPAGRALDDAVALMEKGIFASSLRKKDKMDAMQRLSSLLPPDACR